MNQLLAALVAAISALSNVADRAIAVIATPAPAPTDPQIDPAFLDGIAAATNAANAIAAKLNAAVNAAGSPSAAPAPSATASDPSAPVLSLPGVADGGVVGNITPVNPPADPATLTPAVEPMPESPAMAGHVQ